MKKVFIISSVLLVVVLIFLGIYNFAFRRDAPKSAQVVAPSAADSTKDKSSDKIEKITAISSGPIFGAVIDKKTEELKYYDANSGLAWKMDSLGQDKQQITDTKIAGLENISWSPDHNKVLMTVKKNGQEVFNEYDFQSQKTTLLKNGLDTVAWDNLGTNIFYKYFDSATKKKTLNVANPDGSGWQKITDIDSRNTVIQPVPQTSLISFWNAPNANEETQLKIASVTGGDARTIFSGKYGSDYLWAPDGSKALVSTLQSRNSKIISLGSITIDGKYQDLNIPTFVSKCVWSDDSKEIFYALPGGIPVNSIMPNDYQDDKFTTNDTFWKMNMATGEKSRIIDTADIVKAFDSIGMFLSPTEDALYFTNRIDQKLYRLAL